MMNVLVTGGAGFIGSHVCVALAARGHRVGVAGNTAKRDLAQASTSV
jgi:UDP-glucose 4-epimerase